MKNKYSRTRGIKRMKESVKKGDKYLWADCDEVVTQHEAFQF